MSRSELAVRDVRGNSSGLYVTLNEATRGAIGTTATVTVKKTKHGNYACLTCLVVDCRHARFVEGGFNDGSIQEAA